MSIMSSTDRRNNFRRLSGIINKIRPYISIAGILEGANNVTYGRLVVQGTASERLGEYVKLATATGGVPIGVVVNEHLKAPETIGGDVDLAEGEPLELMTKGSIQVEVESDVTAGMPVYFRHTADGLLTTLGIFAGASGTGLDLLTGAKFLTDSSVCYDGKKIATLLIPTELA